MRTREIMLSLEMSLLMVLFGVLPVFAAHMEGTVPPTVSPTLAWDETPEPTPEPTVTPTPTPTCPPNKPCSQCSDCGCENGRCGDPNKHCVKTGLDASGNVVCGCESKCRKEGDACTGECSFDKKCEFKDQSHSDCECKPKPPCDADHCDGYCPPIAGCTCQVMPPDELCSCGKAAEGCNRPDCNTVEGFGKARLKPNSIKNACADADSKCAQVICGGPEGLFLARLGNGNHWNKRDGTWICIKKCCPSGSGKFDCKAKFEWTPPPQSWLGETGESILKKIGKEITREGIDHLPLP